MGTQWTPRGFHDLSARWKEQVRDNLLVQKDSAHHGTARFIG